MVNFFCGIRKAPPLFDTCIVPGGAASLYALFEVGLTLMNYLYVHNCNRRRNFCTI